MESGVFLEFLDCVRLVFMRMADSLRMFSTQVSGPLGFHATLASNRLRLVAENLGHALKFAGASKEISSYEEAENRCGSLLKDIFNRLEGSLENLRRRLAAGNELDLRTELDNFDDFLEMAEKAFTYFASDLMNLEDEKMKMLGFALRVSAEDIRLIRRRHDELRRSNKGLSFVR